MGDVGKLPQPAHPLALDQVALLPHHQRGSVLAQGGQLSLKSADGLPKRSSVSGAGQLVGVGVPERLLEPGDPPVHVDHLLPLYPHFGASHAQVLLRHRQPTLRLGQEPTDGLPHHEVIVVGPEPPVVTTRLQVRRVHRAVEAAVEASLAIRPVRRISASGQGLADDPCTENPVPHPVSIAEPVCVYRIVNATGVLLSCSLPTPTQHRYFTPDVVFVGMIRVTMGMLRFASLLAVPPMNGPACGFDAVGAILRR
ncbi:MAG: hypothetical protein ABR540_10970 [Acidimicrobiales bacterium]